MDKILHQHIYDILHYNINKYLDKEKFLENNQIEMFVNPATKIPDKSYIWMQKS